MAAVMRSPPAAWWRVGTYHLVEQRQVVVGHHVAGRARVAVPVPGPAHVGAALDDPDALDPLLAQARGGQERGEAAADEHRRHRDRLTGFDRTAIGSLAYPAKDELLRPGR
jgi:hypothetical protein